MFTASCGNEMSDNVDGSSAKADYAFIISSGTSLS